jgi:hypothetical protein
LFFKAEAVGEAIINRAQMLCERAGLGKFVATNIELLGAEATYGARATAQTRELVLRMSVRHDSPQGIKIFAKEIASVSSTFN